MSLFACHAKTMYHVQLTNVRESCLNKQYTVMAKIISLLQLCRVSPSDAQLQEVYGVLRTSAWETRAVRERPWARARRPIGVTAEGRRKGTGPKYSWTALRTQTSSMGRTWRQAWGLGRTAERLHNITQQGEKRSTKGYLISQGNVYTSPLTTSFQVIKGGEGKGVKKEMGLGLSHNTHITVVSEKKYSVLKLCTVYISCVLNVALWFHISTVYSVFISINTSKRWLDLWPSTRLVVDVLHT